MRNEISISPRCIPIVTFISLSAGQMFRFAYPWNEDNVYMKLDLPPGHAVHLNTGTLYAITIERSVIPLNSEQSVYIKSIYPCVEGSRGNCPN
jgi:hypothetical protein